MGLTTSPTCGRCGQKQREANYGGYYDHTERECFDAVMERVKRLEAQVAVLAQHVGLNVQQLPCSKCDRAPESHPAWDCERFIPRDP